MLAALRRLRWPPTGRLLARAVGYWSVAAAVVAGVLAVSRWVEQLDVRPAADAARNSRVERAQQGVARALVDARSDLHLLAALGVVSDYVRAPDTVRRVALARDLFAFMATRDWCRRVVVSAGDASVAAERQPGQAPCDGFASVAASFPTTEALLASARAGSGVRVCLGLPLASGGAGRAALVAEAEPRSLFAELAANDATGEFFGLRDAAGQWVIALDPASGPAKLRPLRLASWNGPASGTWQLAASSGPPAGTFLSGSRDVAVLLVLLAASAGGALVLARAAQARLRAETIALHQLALFQSVSDNVPTAICLKDAEGRYLGCNAAFETLVGRSRDAIIGRDVRAVLAPGTTMPHEEADRGILAGGAAQQYEACVAATDGSLRDMLICKAAVRDAGGRTTGVTAALVDITERKAAELQLRRSLEALKVAKEAAEAGTRAKSEFLAMMGHEMRTPLHAVLGASSLLSEGTLSGEQSEQVAMIRSAGQALLDLIDDLLDFSRIESGRFALDRVAFDVRQLVQDTVALVAARARDKGLALSSTVDASVPARAAGDPGRIRQILLNLLANAIEFTERGGVRAHVELVAREGDELVFRLRVLDSGVGIPPQLLTRVFEPFAGSERSPDRQRTTAGLGLAMTRRLVELMGGRIAAESTPGIGSEFKCTIRLSEAGAGERPASGASVACDRRGHHVLLVEDNLVNQRVTVALLERIGCRVDVANDGREAVEATSRSRYELVLMDCRMPRMNGYDAAREIRRREGQGRHVPIVALTAHALRGDRERCLAAGMSDYVAKPVDLAGLERVLARHCAGEPLPPPAGPEAGRDHSLVDPQALASLQSLDKDGPGFLATLVHDFDTGARQSLADMQLAVRGNDCERLRGAAHNMKGSAGILGARGISELCRRLEHLGEVGALGEAPALLAQLTHEHEAVMSVLREATASVTPAPVPALG
jgi:PAS domain S-box-containing protein